MLALVVAVQVARALAVLPGRLSEVRGEPGVVGGSRPLHGQV